MTTGYQVKIDQGGAKYVVDIDCPPELHECITLAVGRAIKDVRDGMRPKKMVDGVPRPCGCPEK